MMHHLLRPSTGVTLLVLVTCAALGACRAAPPGPGAQAATPLHYSERLRSLMQRMNALLYERNQTELEIDKERLERARELASAAATLAREVGSEGLPGSVDETARASFAGLAQELAATAAELDALAAARRYSELSPQMERVAHVCATCHLRSRDRSP